VAAVHGAKTRKSTSSKPGYRKCPTSISPPISRKLSLHVACITTNSPMAAIVASAPLLCPLDLPPILRLPIPTYRLQFMSPTLAEAHQTLTLTPLRTTTFICHQLQASCRDQAPLLHSVLSGNPLLSSLSLLLPVRQPPPRLYV